MLNLFLIAWIKDLDMCVQDCNLTEHKAVQLVKDYTTEHAHGAVEFYLNTNDQWSYSRLIEHLRMLLESGETFSSLLSNFYATKSQVNEVLKMQFAHQLQDQYFTLMAHNLLKVAPPDTMFTKFQLECISLFGTRSKKRQ